MEGKAPERLPVNMIRRVTRKWLLLLSGTLSLEVAQHVLASATYRALRIQGCGALAVSQPVRSDPRRRLVPLGLGAA